MKCQNQLCYENDSKTGCCKTKFKSEIKDCHVRKRFVKILNLAKKQFTAKSDVVRWLTEGFE